MNVFQDLAQRFLSLLTLLAALIHYVGKLEELLLRKELDKISNIASHFKT